MAEIFTLQDIDFIKSIGGELDEIDGHYFSAYNDNKLHISLYGAENGYYFAEVGDSCAEYEGSATALTLKEAIKKSCEEFHKKSTGDNDFYITEARESIDKLYKELNINRE